MTYNNKYRVVHFNYKFNIKSLDSTVGTEMATGWTIEGWEFESK
jgi:hypothetical protein